MDSRPQKQTHLTIMWLMATNSLSKVNMDLPAIVHIVIQPAASTPDLLGLMGSFYVVCVCVFVCLLA